MIFPCHDIWRNCLQDAMNAIPEYSFSYATPNFFLNNWRSIGQFIPTANSSNKHVELSAHPYELGAAIFNDAHALMNQATEHRATLYRLLQADGDPSPSWAFVTIYYWGLFVALAWSRVVGKSIVYLDKTALIPLFQGSGSQGAGGAYSIRPGEIVGTSQRKVLLKKCTHSHFHEAVWSFLSGDMYERYSSADQDEKPTDMEVELEKRIFLCLAHDHFKEAHVWPSLLRNAINYRPGFSYTEVSGLELLDICSYMRKFSCSSILEIVSEYEGIDKKLRASGNSLDPVEFYAEASKLLLLKNILLSELCESILDTFPLNESVGMARSSRVKYFRSLNIRSASALWPI